MSKKRQRIKLTVKRMLFVGVIIGLVFALVYLGNLFLFHERSNESGPARSLDTSIRDSIPKSKISDGIMEYIYNAPESDQDIRYNYHWEVLRIALEKTKSKYGPYKMKRSQVMTEKRQLLELKNQTGEITVLYLDTRPELEKMLLPIHIPVDKNFGGYRIMLIRHQDQAKMNQVKTLDDLKKVSIGLGYGWIDVDILKEAKFNVVTGSNYEGLFKMLMNKRFDAFSRSAVEVLDEYEVRGKQYVNMKIEDSLLLYYPLPMYFWFSKNPEGKLLAQRAKEGMEQMISDGTYEKIFLKYHGHKAEMLHLKNRRVFQINNPFLVPETPFSDKRLWYNPLNN